MAGGLIYTEKSNSTRLGCPNQTWEPQASLLSLVASSGPFSFPPFPKYKESSLSAVHPLVICFPSLCLGVFPQKIYKTD